MGREARAKRARRDLESVAQLRDIAARARAALGNLGLSLAPHHTLMQQIRLVERAADAGGTTERPGATAQEKSDVAYAFLEAARLAELQKALSVFPNVRNSQDHLKWIKGNLDAFDKEGNPALDHLFEIEIAGLLARGADVVVEMAEPDILVTDGDARIALACKRPKKFESFDGAFRKAGQQIEEHALKLGIPSSVILIDVSLLLLPAKEGVDALAFDTAELAESMIQSRLQGLLAVADAERARVLGKGIAGVLYTGYIVYAVSNTLELKGRRFSHRVWNSNIPGSEQILLRLASLLK